ncbi:hypothetical protein, partial [Tabrizicola sp. TH137]|uniref:hypothetical protein n=1 Tax=Tabrizicola sp. TH137 TaxID=2067452 RepID=UPI001C1F739F
MAAEAPSNTAEALALCREIGPSFCPHPHRVSSQWKSTGIFGLAEIIRALETSGRPETIRGVRWPWPSRADL